MSLSLISISAKTQNCNVYYLKQKCKGCVTNICSISFAQHTTPRIHNILHRCPLPYFWFFLQSLNGHKCFFHCDLIKQRFYLTCNSSNWPVQVCTYKAWYMSPETDSDHVDGAQRGTALLKRSAISLVTWYFYRDTAKMVTESIRYIPASSQWKQWGCRLLCACSPLPSDNSHWQLRGSSPLLWH